WWTGTQPDYLAWVADTNLAHQTYQAAVGTDYITLVAATTAADVAYITARADAQESRVIAQAGAQESYAHSLAGARQTYLGAMATAGHDLASSGDESAHATAVQTAADTYRSTAATGSGDRRVALATAQSDYTDALHGPGGASQTSQSVVATAVKDFTIADANSYADLVIDLAELDRDFGILSVEAYADAVAALAASSPWAALAADEAAAEATRTTALLTEEALLTIAQATAARDEAIAAATATEALTTAESTATATRAVALAGAAVTRAEEEAAAETASPAAAAGELPRLTGPSGAPESPVLGSLPSAGALSSGAGISSLVPPAAAVQQPPALVTVPGASENDVRVPSASEILSNQTGVNWWIVHLARISYGPASQFIFDHIDAIEAATHQAARDANHAARGDVSSIAREELAYAASAMANSRWVRWGFWAHVPYWRDYLDWVGSLAQQYDAPAADRGATAIELTDDTLDLAAIGFTAGMSALSKAGGIIAAPGSVADDLAGAGSRALRPGSISGNPQNSLVKTGTPLKNSFGWRKRWYRMTQADEEAYGRACADRLHQLYQETRHMPYHQAKAYIFRAMGEFRNAWLKDFVQNRKY
ncbi:hypothetical protein ACFL5Q_07430, partial [Planctomycetota bacterium]